MSVVPLGSAFPSPALFPLDKLARCLTPAMRARDPGELVEDLTQGNLQLRHQIGLRYGHEGTVVGADEITITNGAMEALNLCLQVLTQPGDVVAVESPAFYGALQALERLQLRAVEVATHPRDGVDLDSLAEVLARHPVKACWFMPQFQNPLGSLMPDATKAAMVDLLARHGVPLIEDDVYGELHFGPGRVRPAKAYDRSGLVLHCASFSKCLAPGYRVGWTAAGRFAPSVQRLKLMTTLSTAIPSQWALARYLQGGGYDRHLRQLRQTLRAEVAAMRARSLDAGVIRAAKRWMHRDGDKVPASAATELAKARAASPMLDKMVTMREELRQMWLNTTVSREQLTRELQAWCQRAEASGIAALQEFSLRLRAVRV